MMRELKFGAWWLVGGVLIAACVLVASLVPTTELPATGLSDKVWHVLAYGALSVWFAGTVQRRYYLHIGVALFAFGILIEIAQGSMGLGRIAELVDVFANGAGALLGLIVAWLGAGDWMQLIERWFGAT